MKDPPGLQSMLEGRRSRLLMGTKDDGSGSSGSNGGDALRNKEQRQAGPHSSTCPFYTQDSTFWWWWWGALLPSINPSCKDPHRPDQKNVSQFRIQSIWQLKSTTTMGRGVLHK